MPPTRIELVTSGYRPHSFRNFYNTGNELNMTTTLTSLVAIAATATTGPNGLLTASPATTQVAYTTDGPSNDGSGEKGECRLLGPFSLLVQAALGALALLSLVYKRWRERPQRPIKVWAFDVSKQVFGSAMLHLANLLMSMFSAGQFDLQSSLKPNPCSFYLLNLGIDVSSPPGFCFCNTEYRVLTG